MKVRKVIDRVYKEGSGGNIALVKTESSYAIGWGIGFKGLNLETHSYSVSEYESLPQAINAWEKELYTVAREGYGAVDHEAALKWAANRCGYIEARNTSEYSSACSWDREHEKQVRRRVEDALRKNVDFSALLEIAEIAGVEDIGYYPVCPACQTKQAKPLEEGAKYTCCKCGREQTI